MGGEVVFPGSVANLAEKYVGAAGHYLYGYMEEVHWQQEGKQPSDRTAAKDRAKRAVLIMFEHLSSYTSNQPPLTSQAQEPIGSLFA